jgi:type VI secretion system secreted protein VgrG
LFNFSILPGAVEPRVVRFAGEEGMSRLFELQVEFASEDPAIAFSDVVGKPALLTIDDGREPRLLHGMVSRFEMVGERPRYTLYQAVVVPQVWRLLLRHDCRTFQCRSTPDIIKQVLDGAGISSEDYKLCLSGAYEPRDFCVQYRESDWAFLSRLMEEDGIFYFFEHHEDRHVLVLGDGVAACLPISGDDEVPFRRPSGLASTEDHIHRFRCAEELQPGQVSLRDFNFKRPTLSMHAENKAAKGMDLEVYDYPGEYQHPGQGSAAKGATIAALRLQAWQAARMTASGDSTCSRLLPGHLFTLAGHPRDDFNARYLVTHVAHRGEQPQALEEESSHGNSGYVNAFSCLQNDIPYRPARVTPRPLMRGVQTAIVVGPEGEEVHTDEHGRVQVQFHWDRQQAGSCWIRVNQGWAGGAWGAVFLPRVGQEVIVDFLEGDPDRPIITGRVYNGQNVPPYPLPNEKTKSTLMSNSSPGGEGFNELRFEDRTGAEQVFIHAQRNMDVHVRHDSMEVILNDCHQTVGSEGRNGKVGDRNEMVLRDRSVTVHRHHLEHVGGDMKLLVGGIDGKGDQDIVVKADKKERVEKDSHLYVKGDRDEKVDKSWSITVGKDVQAQVDQKYALAVGKEIHLKSSTIVIEASSGVTVKGPGGFITIDADGIAISGNMVKVNSGGSALSGSGASPAEPKEPSEATPTVPTPADDGRR